MSDLPSPAATAATRLTLDRALILRWLWLVTVALIVMSIAVNALHYLTGHDTVFGLVPLFDVDNEQSVPTFFSVCLLLASGGMLALISRVSRRRREPFSVHWTVLAVGFFCLGLDEVAGFHENLSRPVRALLGTHSFMAVNWAPVGLAGVLAVGALYVPFLRHLRAPTRWNFILAGAIYVGGAVGVEMLGTAYYYRHGLNFVYSLHTALEEGMEMSGIVLFLGGLLSYYASLGEIVGIAVRAPVRTDEDPL